MKKLMLTLAALLFVSVVALQAQVQDTTSASPSQGYSPALNYDDMEAVTSTDVPASLRSTLQGSEYKGWEEGKVYRHKTSSDYVVVIGDENAKVYRFNSEGKRVEDQATPAPAAPSTAPPTK